MMGKDNIKILLPEAIEFLKDLIRIPSTSGQEQEAIQLIHRRFTPLVDEIELVPLDNNLKNDPDYSFPIEGITLFVSA